MFTKLADNPSLSKPYKFEKTKFGIKHFAGEVKYEIANFLDKNRDTMSSDFQEVFEKSTVALVSALFTEKPNVSEKVNLMQYTQQIKIKSHTTNSSNTNANSAPAN